MDVNKKIKLHSDPRIAMLFQIHWQRILKNVYLYVYPFSQQEINRMQNNRFWKNLISEILENANFSIIKICETISAPKKLIHDLLWDTPHQVVLAHDICEKLLTLHELARPDLQHTEEKYALQHQSEHA